MLDQYKSHRGEPDPKNPFWDNKQRRYNTLHYTDGFHFHLDDFNYQKRTWKDFSGEMRTENVWICPACQSHEQGECNDVYDCKNECYIWDGKLMRTIGQCNCYSESHGVRVHKY